MNIAALIIAGLLFSPVLYGASLEQTETMSKKGNPVVLYFFLHELLQGSRDFVSEVELLDNVNNDSPYRFFEYFDAIYLYDELGMVTSVSSTELTRCHSKRADWYMPCGFADGLELELHNEVPSPVFLPVAFRLSPTL